MAIHDWSDLLQPRLKGRLAFLDSPRELVGVALKTLGLPYNCTDSQLRKSGVSLQQLQRRLQQLRDQVGQHSMLLKSILTFAKYADLISVCVPGC